MEPFIAEIKMFGGNFAPVGWAFCNGQLLSISQNTALFSLLGTTYGGNGVTTFGLPNLQGRAPLHFGNGAGLTPRQLGESGGTETVTLSQTQMPTHSHSLGASSKNGDASTPSGNVNAVYVDPGTLSPVNIYGTAIDTAMNSSAVGNAGGSLPHNNMQPYLCVNFIIALQGIFPSRS